MSERKFRKRERHGSYDVLENGNVVGIVARTRHGWNAWTVSGTLVVSDYPGSRAVAAGIASERTKSERTAVCGCRIFVPSDNPADGARVKISRLCPAHKKGA